jgi:hypothetical protein
MAVACVPGRAAAAPAPALLLGDVTRIGGDHELVEPEAVLQHPETDAMLSRDLDLEQGPFPAVMEASQPVEGLGVLLLG